MAKIKELRVSENPYLIAGDIMHQRFSPKSNGFKYKSIYISFPISKINNLKTRLFSINKFNFFGLDFKDYGIDKNNPGDFNNWVFDILEKNNVNGVDDIILVTHPKILGHVFNPVSFWVCLNKNQKMIAVLCEVHNTAKQKHCYLCFNKDLSEINSNQWLESKKEFYVSPFLAIEGTYKFKFEYDDDKLNFFINHFVDGELKLTTYLKCNFKTFNNKNLLFSFIRVPFATLKTVVLIHYQALKLYFKKIKFYKYPQEQENKVTNTDA